jgi:hypothetical protein
MGVSEEVVRPDEGQVAYGNGMVMDVLAQLVRQLQKWKCLRKTRNDKLNWGPPRSLSRL